MKIAIFGATSEIAKDLIISLFSKDDCEMILFVRRQEETKTWLHENNISARCKVVGYESFCLIEQFDVIINFVGVGNPSQAKKMEHSILETTYKYDSLALEYIQAHPTCRYIFLSSGAAYFSEFSEPANENTKARVPVNSMKSSYMYAAAKLIAECRHRALIDLPIVDIRVFNYFSSTQNLTSSYLICELIAAIKTNQIFKTSNQNIFRDYIGPEEFFCLIKGIISSKPNNDVVDCYSKGPIDKTSLLELMKSKYGLKYEVYEAVRSAELAEVKFKYYSTNYSAKKYGYNPIRDSKI